MRIAFVLSFVPNPRMHRRLDLFKEKFAVSLIYWNRLNEKVEISGLDEVHEISLKTNFGSPLKRAFKMRKFFQEALKYLKSFKPDIIYVQGLDMLSIACKYAKDGRIFYEIADLNTLLVDKQKSIIRKVASRYLRRQERRLIKRIDTLVITSLQYYDAYYQGLISKDKVLCIPNIPDLQYFVNYHKKNYGKFRVGYIGSVRYEEQLKMLIDASKIAGIEVLIAGYDYLGEIKTYAQGREYVNYHGPYDYKQEVASLYSQVDLIYAVYDNQKTNVGVAIPNRLYEAIFCELPIIVSKGTYLADYVLSLGVGLAIDSHDLGGLVLVLSSLKEKNDEYQYLVNNCRKSKDLIDIKKYNSELIKRIEKR